MKPDHEMRKQARALHLTALFAYLPAEGTHRWLGQFLGKSFPSFGSGFTLILCGIDLAFLCLLLTYLPGMVKPGSDNLGQLLHNYKTKMCTTIK